jgi:hypothetical protein
MWRFSFTIVAMEALTMSSVSIIADVHVSINYIQRLNVATETQELAPIALL